MTGRPNLRFAARYWLGFLGILLLWLAGATWGVPWLIRSAYRGDSLELLNRLITGQSTHPVDSYLADWARLANRLSLLLVLSGIAVFVLIALDVPRRVRAWNGALAEREASLKSHPPRIGPGGYVLLGAWIGMLTGIVEAAYIAWKFAAAQWVPAHLAMSPEVVWMAPLAGATAFAVAGALLAALSFAWKRVGTVKVAVLLLASLSLFTLFRATAGRLELWGAIPLAIGAAYQLARLAAAYAERLRAVAVRSGAVLVLIVIAVGTGLRLQQTRSEHRAFDALPAAEAGAPNVLLIILDTVRSANLSLQGYERPTTPNLERLGRGGVVFEQAIATAPWTLPSHASMFTGRPHHELSVDWKVPLDDTYPTLAEVLASHGYATAGFVGNFFYCGRQFGLDRGFIHYEEQPTNLGRVIRSSWLTRELASKVNEWRGVHQDLVRKRAADVNAEFLGWVAEQDPERPWFVFLNYYDAHGPYLPPEPWNVRFADKQPRYWLEDGTEYTEQDYVELLAAYDGSIAYLDDQLGRLFDALERDGVLDRTLVIVTSDHGDQFGEHGLTFHSNSLYLPLLHVPMLLRFPGAVPAGPRPGETATILDIPATVMDLLDLGDSPFPGASLERYWRAASEVNAATEGDAATEADEATGEDTRPIVALSEITVNKRIPAWQPAWRGPMKSLVSGSLHYIRNGDGSEELYDIAVDPLEINDLRDSVRFEPSLVALRSTLGTMLDQSEPAAEQVAGSVPDPAGEDGGAAGLDPDRAEVAGR